MADRERVLFVHAHPDDETIATGGTIATLIDAGSEVIVVTGTRGERGEVIPAELQPALESHAAMASLRTGELAEAMKILGVTDHRYLGGATARWSGRGDHVYVDSGMRWGASGKAEPADETDPASLTAADLADVVSDIASVIIAVGPDAVVSYAADGGYGHPDHIRIHDAARRAADLYGVPFFAIATAGSLAVDVSPVLDRKRAALAAYRSQLTLNGDTMVMPGGQREPVSSVERFERLDAEPTGGLPFADQHPVTRFAAAVLAGVVGAIFGGLLSIYNQSTVAFDGQQIWIGVIAAVPILAVLFIGLRLAFGTRVIVGFAAVACIVIVGVLSVLGAGGTVLIPWNGPGIVWQIAPTILAVIVLAWPQGRRSRPGKLATPSTQAPSKGPQKP